jgi:hypothetical protein
MNPLDSAARSILMLGGILVILGLLLLGLGRVPFAGRLPGDFHLRWGSGSCYFPLATGLVLSILATIVLNLILWVMRK